MSTLMSAQIHCGISAPAVFDIATLDLTVWLRAGSYNAGTGTWTGTASAGSSGSRNFTNGGAGKPTAGASLNSLATVSFASASSQWLSNTTLSNVISTTAYSYWALIKNTSWTAAAGKTAGYSNGAILSDVTSYWAACGSTTNSGVAQLYHWDSSAHGVEASITDGSWALIQGYFNGSQLGIRVNSGSWDTVSATTLGSISGGVYMGSNYDDTKYLNALLADVGCSKTAFTTTQFDNIKARINSDYVLSL